MKWLFDVEWSHLDEIKVGHVALGLCRVAVWADTYTEASLTALQMTAATGRTPTGLHYLE